jgi:hypothetical protein
VAGSANQVVYKDGSNNPAGSSNFTYNGSTLLVSGSSSVLRVAGSGSGTASDLFAVDGANGRLFEVSDDLSNSLFSVNTIAGIPVFEAFADNTVKIGKFNQENIVVGGDLQLSGSIRMTSLASTADTTVVTYNTSTKTIGYNTIAGPQGAQGAAGNNGNNGAQGAAGNNGNNGNDGAQGAAGNNGNNGAQGAAGNNGNNGNDGAQGATGAQGAQGATGAQGAAGNNGNTGAQGAQGATGPVGGSNTQVLYNSGGTAVGSGNMVFDGTTLTVAALTESSALKYKQDIAALSASLDSLKQIQGVSFIRKGEQKRQLGFIAEDILKVYPELVKFENGEVDSVYYQRVTAVLVEALKELTEKVELQESVINDLIARVTKLEAK